MEANIGKVTLQALWEEKVEGCTRCELHKTRKNIVFGAGETERPDFLFLGEAPGAMEDEMGKPFVGRAGTLLDRMLQAMGYTRDRVYLCNAIACRPPGNRDPLAEELTACHNLWATQIMAVRPRMIVALGKVAGNALMGTRDKSIVQMRRKIDTWQRIPVQVTYHPAAMLRQEQYKQPTWEDLQRAMREVERLKAQGDGPLFEEAT